MTKKSKPYSGRFGVLTRACTRERHHKRVNKVLMKEEEEVNREARVRQKTAGGKRRTGKGSMMEEMKKEKQQAVK